MYMGCRPDKTHGVAIRQNAGWRFAYPAYKNTVQAVSKFAMVRTPRPVAQMCIRDSCRCCSVPQS